MIQQKLEMVREWLQTNFNIDIDDVRNEVQRRQWLTDADGNFVTGPDGRFINRLTAPLDTDPSKTLMESLLDDVNKYRDLQTAE